jgi:hypothetical protein
MCEIRMAGALLFRGIGILVSFGDTRVVWVHRVSFWSWLVLVGVHLAIYLPKLRGIPRAESADPHPRP